MLGKSKQKIQRHDFVGRFALIFRYTDILPILSYCNVDIIGGFLQDGWIAKIHPDFYVGFGEYCRRTLRDHMSTTA